MIKQFNLWNCRNLSILGKILISKTHGITNLVYSMIIGEMSNKHIKGAQNVINVFIDTNWI